MNSNPRAHGAPPWFTPKKTDVEPRTRTHGDLPSIKTIPQAMGEQTPHKWVVGHTLEWEFALPMPVNPAYQSKPSGATALKTTKPRPAPPSKTNNPSEAKAPATQEAKRQDRQEYVRQRDQTPGTQGVPSPVRTGTQPKGQGTRHLQELQQSRQTGPDPLPHLRRETLGVQAAHHGQAKGTMSQLLVTIARWPMPAPSPYANPPVTLRAPSP